MSSSQSDTRAPDTSEGVVRRFLQAAVLAVLRRIPATILALVVGGFIGGLIGLAAIPFTPLFAVAGALVLGLPVAIWEYWLLKNDTSPTELFD